jgi:hypothetical protein
MQRSTPAVFPGERSVMSEEQGWGDQRAELESLLRTKPNTRPEGGGQGSCTGFFTSDAPRDAFVGSPDVARR